MILNDEELWEILVAVPVAASVGALGFFRPNKPMSGPSLSAKQQRIMYVLGIVTGIALLTCLFVWARTDSNVAKLLSTVAVVISIAATTMIGLKIDRASRQHD